MDTKGRARSRGHASGGAAPPCISVSEAGLRRQRVVRDELVRASDDRQNKGKRER